MRDSKQLILPTTVCKKGGSVGDSCQLTARITLYKQAGSMGESSQNSLECSL